jgi:hypothetical protein
MGSLSEDHAGFMGTNIYDFGHCTASLVLLKYISRSRLIPANHGEFSAASSDQGNPYETHVRLTDQQSRINF